MNNTILFVKKSKENGFVISIEAVLSLVIFSLIILSINFPKDISLIELAIIQQENDLIRVWSAKETNEQEMIIDAKKVLGENVSLSVNSKEILLGKKTNNCYSSNAELIYQSGKKEINLTTCW